MRQTIDIFLGYKYLVRIKRVDIIYKETIQIFQWNSIKKKVRKIRISLHSVLSLVVLVHPGKENNQSEIQKLWILNYNSTLIIHKWEQKSLWVIHKLEIHQTIEFMLTSPRIHKFQKILNFLSFWSCYYVFIESNVMKHEWDNSLT